MPWSISMHRPSWVLIVCCFKKCVPVINSLGTGLEHQRLSSTLPLPTFASLSIQGARGAEAGVSPGYPLTITRQEGAAFSMPAHAPGRLALALDKQKEEFLHTVQN